MKIDPGSPSFHSVNGLRKYQTVPEWKRMVGLELLYIYRLKSEQINNIYCKGQPFRLTVSNGVTVDCNEISMKS